MKVWKAGSLQTANGVTVVTGSPAITDRFPYSRERSVAPISAIPQLTFPLVRRWVAAVIVAQLRTCWQGRLRVALSWGGWVVGRGVSRCGGQCDGELGAGVVVADVDGSVVGVDDGRDDGKAQAGPAGVAAAGTVQAGEPFEDPFAVRGGDAGSVVGDGESRGGVGTAQVDGLSAPALPRAPSCPWLTSAATSPAPWVSRLSNPLARVLCTRQSSNTAAKANH